MTGRELVKDEAQKCGFAHPIDDEMADYILWEYTGFPGFYYRPDGTSLNMTAEENEECLRRQIRNYLKPEGCVVAAPYTNG